MRRSIFLMLATGVFACAQPAPEAQRAAAIQNFVNNPDPDADKIADFVDNYAALLQAQAAQEAAARRPAVDSMGKRVLEERLEFRRTDLQAGSTSGASGSTSSILSPLLPAVFGVGFENGGITRTVTGSTITLKANPAGIFCASSEDAAAVARRSQDACRTLWKKASVMASFDTSRDSASTGLESLKAINNQFTELAVRVELINRRVLTGQRFNDAFDDIIAAEATRLVNTMAATIGVRLAGYRNSLAQKLTLLLATPAYQSADNAGKIRQVTQIVEAEAVPALPPEDLDRLHDDWVDALAAYRRQQNAVLNAPMLTADYSYQQPDLATAETMNSIVPEGIRPPNLHTGRLVYAQGIAGKRIDFTANASASWFGDTRPGMSGSFRDFRAGGQATIRMRDVPGYGAPSLHFAFLYTYLHQQPLGLGIVAFNEAQIKEKGHIRLFQAKIEFPTANNSVRIPISFTASNRTELIKESDVRGQIGISFNLDQLFAQAQQ